MRHLKGEDLIEDSLRALEEEFGQSFVRIHRNALVSVRFLEGIERNREGQYFVRLRGCQAPLQVSRRMASELRDRFRTLHPTPTQSERVVERVEVQPLFAQAARRRRSRGSLRSIAGGPAA